MRKVYSGDKCVLFSAEAVKSDSKSSRVIVFTSAQALHKEYRQFVKSSKLETLIVTGDVERAWKVFRSLFSFIEAAGGLVVNPKGELLMIYRNKHWDIPKGKMEPGESPDETAVREVKEECGIDKLKIVRPIQSTYHTFYLNKRDFIKQTYWFEMLSDDSVKPTPQKEEGIEEVKWMSKPELEKIIDKVYLSLREVIAVYAPSA